MTARQIVAAPAGSERESLHSARLQWLEKAEGPVLAVPANYPDGHHVPNHRHSRAQLLYAGTGVVVVSTGKGRWMVPPDHAIWLPAGVEHAVEMQGAVEMRSIYVRPEVLDGMVSTLRVLGMTDLVRSLIAEAVCVPPQDQPSQRTALLLQLLLHEISRLPEQPLALPFPADPRLAELCRRFLKQPSSHATVDSWAEAAGMSRRSFTRAFHRQTGLGLSTWRQQACLFAALPRLAEGESVTSVALDLGYESVAAFTTMFKRMLGQSPRSWLRNGSEPAMRDRGVGWAAQSGRSRRN